MDLFAQEIYRRANPVDAAGDPPASPRRRQDAIRQHEDHVFEGAATVAAAEGEGGEAATERQIGETVKA
ncbi:MAG: hypothetical protein VXW43_19790, partial [Pseudomonadota bacterium]|nr:hypothetical protein [Pseudomonadota bacterium]